MRPHRRLWLSAAVVLALWLSPHQASAQQAGYETPPAEAITITSESPEAIDLFWSSVYDLDNVYFARAAERAMVPSNSIRTSGWRR